MVGTAFPWLLPHFRPTSENICESHKKRQEHFYNNIYKERSAATPSPFTRCSFSPATLENLYFLGHVFEHFSLKNNRINSGKGQKIFRYPKHGFFRGAREKKKDAWGNIPAWIPWVDFFWIWVKIGRLGSFGSYEILNFVLPGCKREDQKKKHNRLPPKAGTAPKRKKNKKIRNRAPV